jgi:hypothetical protein
MSSTRIKERLRSALKARGGTLSLLSVFKEFDTDNSGQLSWEEFCGLIIFDIFISHFYFHIF